MATQNVNDNVCEAIREILVGSSLGDEPSPEESARVEEHLKGCETCRAFEELMARTDGLISEAAEAGPSMETVDSAPLEMAPADDLVSRVVSRVHGSPSPDVTTRPHSGRGASLLHWFRGGPHRAFAAVAACLILLLGLQAVIFLRWARETEDRARQDKAELLSKLEEARVDSVSGQLASLRQELAQTRKELDEAIQKTASQAGGLDTKAIEKLLQEREAVARQEISALREELEKTRNHLEEALREAVSRPRLADSLYSPVTHEKALKVVRATYVPRRELSMSTEELSALLEVVQGTTLFASGHYEPAIRLFRRAADGFTTPRFRILSLFALGTSQKCAGLYEASIETYDRILVMTRPEARREPIRGEPETSGPSRGQRDMGTPPAPERTSDPSERGRRQWDDDDPNTAYRAMAFHFRGWSLFCLAERDVDGGNEARARDRLADAKRCYDQALSLVPEYAKVRLNLWKLHSLRAKLLGVRTSSDERDRCLAEGVRQLGLAEESLLSRIKARPDDAKSHFTLAMLHAWQKKDGTALKYLDKAVQLDPSLATLLRSEHAFDRFALTEQYKRLTRLASEYPERAALGSLFTDADFPSAGEPDPTSRR